MSTPSNPRNWCPGTACCHAGRKVAYTCGSTGSTSARRAARERRRRVRSTSTSHHSDSDAAGSPLGRNAPSLTRRCVASERSAVSTTAGPRLRACAASATLNGPWVRAYRDTRSPTGSATGSRNARGTPMGKGWPRASRIRAASSTAQ